MNSYPSYQRWAIYVGGFVGPFSGQALGVVLPEFGQSFGIGVSTASITLSAYLFPFAIVMLISTRLIARLSPSRVIMWAYAVTLAAAVVLVVTPWWWLFLVGYCIMGVANAFTTPVLQIVLKRITPSSEIGSALGTYTAMQSLGILSAPLIAGVTAGLSWRLIFLLTLAAVLAILLIRVPNVPAEPPRRVSGGGIALAGVAAKMLACYAVGLCVIGLAFIAALHAGERFGLDAFQRGLVIMCGGLLAFIVSRSLGRLGDRIGAQKMLVLSLIAAAMGLALYPVVGSPWLLALLWAVTVTAAQAAQTSINVTVLSAEGGEKFLSTVQAFRYFGSSSTPLLILPVFNLHASWGFFIPAALLVVAASVQPLLPMGKQR